MQINCSVTIKLRSIELNLPVEPCYLKFMIKNISSLSNILTLDQIQLTNQVFSTALDEQIHFETSNSNIGICVVAVSDQYVAFVGLAIVDLNNSDQQQLRVQLSHCSTQHGHMVIDVVVDSIQKRTRQLEQLVQYYKNLAEERQSSIKSENELESQNIINKLTEKYEHSVANNLSLKQDYESRILKLQQRHLLRTQILRSKLKNEQALRRIIAVELDQIKTHLQQYINQNL